MIERTARSERFFKTLPRTPYALLDKGMGCFLCSKQAALRMPYLQPNHPHLAHWLVIDLDRSVFEPWQTADLAEPNIVSFNPENGHCHLFYAIDGVCTSPSGRPAPIQYLAAIQRAMTFALGGDPSYTGFLCKNPFHPRWHSFERHTGVYPLCKLEGLLDLSYRNWSRKQALADDHFALGRNCALFHRLRYWSYQQVWDYRQSGCFEAWLQASLNQAQSLNDFAQPLGYGEVKSTARSVAKWTWQNYFGKGQKRSGIMGKELAERKIEDLALKQSLSAQRTNQLQRQQTEEKIIDAIGTIIRQGGRVSKAEVSRRTGLHRNTLERHYSHLFLEI